MPIHPEPDFEPIPGYRLIERLGHGGFGEVWKAEAPGGLLKAVKFVYGNISGGKESGQQVERELKGLARMKEVRHPFILSMERFDILDGQLIMVMELADLDLSAKLEQLKSSGLEGLPRQELLKYMREAAEALDFMSNNYDVQHLDIKPSNLFMVGQHVKVADFGLAKDMQGFSAEVTSGVTPVYAAPETFNGQVSRNTDQYSLAIVFQELLTGKRPFPGPSAQQFMLQHLTKEPDVNPLPDHDRPVVRRALAKEPSDRFASCEEFIEELSESKARQAVVVAETSNSALITPAPSAGSIPTSPGAAPTMETVIGIDLGTSNSVVSVMEGNESKVLSNQEGSRLTPSVVAFTSRSDQRLVGEPAKRQATTNASRTVSSIKRFMGRIRKEVAAEEEIVPYSLTGAPEEAVKIEIDEERTYSPQEISAVVLRKLKEAAEDYLGHPVSKAVITVPAYFNDSQRQATKDAGYIAGLEVLRMINEPTAASLAYGMDKLAKSQKLAVFDLGGGTFDITILRTRNGIFDVMATNGDTHLGGDDFDAALVKYLAEQFREEHGLDPRNDCTALGRMQEAAETAKRELSTQTRTEISLPFLVSDSKGPLHLSITVTRAQFEQLTEDLIERCKAPCLQAIEDAKLSTDEIDEVILVGGSTRMPCVREFVVNLFKKEPYKGVNPDEAVAMGAAVQASMLQGGTSNLLLLDVTPLSLGIETRGGVMTRLIERNTTIPTVVKEVFTTARDGQKEVGIHVLQGEREFASDNRSLGKFWLEGIRSAAAGKVEIEVTFSIDANGILSVSAKELRTELEQSVTIESSSGLSPEEIEWMRRNAEEFAEADRIRRELLEARNSADTACYQAEKMLTRIPAELKDKVRAAIKNVRSAAQGDDPGQITSAIWQLEKVTSH